MVYQLQQLGATKAERQSARQARQDEKQAKKADAQAQRVAVKDARDEWKQYVASLQSLNSNLRNGSLPGDQGLPSAPATPPELVPDLYKVAKDLLERKLPISREIGRNNDIAKGNRVATTGYATGQPAVVPTTTGYRPQPTYVPEGDLPGQVQQPITDAYGATDALVQDTGGGASAPNAYSGGGGGGGGGDFYSSPAQGQQYGGEFAGDSGPAPFPTQKILIVVGIGLAVWLAYRMFKKQG